MVNLTIDGKQVSVPENTTILNAAASAGIKIPTLCYWKDLNEVGACRVCVVEVEGRDKLFASCNNVVEEGMVIHTNTKKVRDTRKSNVELILSEHNSNCATCTRSGNCALQELANDLNIQDLPYEKHLPKNSGNPDFPLIRDNQKCIKCMRCIQVCEKIQHSNIWDVVNSGARVTVDVRDYYNLEDSQCALCGQCITHCPVNALKERDDTQRILDAIDDPEIVTLVQIAPAVRSSWGEAFGLSPEFATVERLAACMRRVGFDYVFDTNFSADLTILEEANEFLEKVKNAENEKFPMFTSCCPGWVRFAKAHHPDFVDQISTSKSPQQMFGAIAKSYYAKILDIDPKKIFCVSIMPCLAKKAECAYPNMNDACGDPDVDASLTIREVDRLIKMMQVMPAAVPEEQMDVPLGTGTGAAVIFGATGGVMEAALRSAYFFVTGEEPDPDSTFVDVRGMDGWKEATYKLPGIDLKVAVVHGLGNADKLLNALRNGEVSYHFVEVMACPGGCVGGGGHPIHNQYDMYVDRAPVLYTLDKNLPLRFSHENPSVVACYQNYLGEPLSELAEHLLHTDLHAWKMPGEK